MMVNFFQKKSSKFYVDSKKAIKYLEKISGFSDKCI